MLSILHYQVSQCRMHHQLTLKISLATAKMTQTTILTHLRLTACGSTNTRVQAARPAHSAPYSPVAAATRTTITSTTGDRGSPS